MLMEVGKPQRGKTMKIRAGSEVELKNIEEYEEGKEDVG